MWEDILLAISDVLLPAVLALLGALLGYGVMFLHTKTEEIKNDHMRRMANDIIIRAKEDIMTSVQHVVQTYVDELKTARADGKLTDEEKRNAYNRAVASFKARMGQHGLEQLQKVVGDLATWIESEIEAAVKNGKKSSTTPTGDV